MQPFDKYTDWIESIHNVVDAVKAFKNKPGSGNPAPAGPSPGAGGSPPTGRRKKRDDTIHSRKKRFSTYQASRLTRITKGLIQAESILQGIKGE